MLQWCLRWWSNDSSRQIGSFYFHHLSFLFFVFFLSGYGAVGLDSNPSYGHTPSHHTPQLSSLSFKHEETLSPPNSIGNSLRPDAFSLKWSADWKAVVSQQGYISNPSFFISQQNRYYPFPFISPHLCLHTYSYTQTYINTLSRLLFKHTKG